jgi:hypothetical protein
MPFVLVRDSEANKVHVYNNLTDDAAKLLVFLASHLDIVSVHQSDKSYDPAVAHEFLTTGEVHECNPVEMDYNAAGESGKFILCAYCERDMDE